MSPLVLDLKHNRFVICLFIDQEALEPNTEKPKLVTLSKFVIKLTLIGKSTMAFLTGQSWHILKSWYLGDGPEQGFRRCFAERLNQCFVSSVTQAKETVLCKGFAIFKQRFLTFLLKNIRVAYYN